LLIEKTLCACVLVAAHRRNPQDYSDPDSTPPAARAYRSDTTYRPARYGGQVRDTFTGERAPGCLITNHIAVERAAGVPPKLKLCTQGTASPQGPAETRGLDDLKLFRRNWIPVRIEAITAVTPRDILIRLIAVKLGPAAATILPCLWQTCNSHLASPRGPTNLTRGGHR